MGKIKRPRLLVSALLLVTALAVAGGVFALHTGLVGAAQPFKLHAVSKNHLPYQKLGAVGPNNTITFPCQTFNTTPRCYGPKQIRNAYNVQGLINQGFNGKGSTIVIIDAFQSPTIKHDLGVFDAIFNLHSPVLNIIAPDGLTPFDPTDPNQVGWSGEITLDVEWAHAIAPYATIDLVLAKSNQDADLLSVTKYAVDNNLGDVISQSFGEAESCADPNLLKAEHQVFQQATKKGITIFASSGDQGAAQPSCDGSSYILSASTPASDPLVTGVGGTALNANPINGHYIGETAWNDEFGASGGGFSSIYTRPSFQSGVPNTRPGARGVPDVAYNADVNTGVLTVWSSSGLGKDLVFIFGGTSAGSPQWAGIIALADAAYGFRLGWINGALYALGKSPVASAFFHDITYGNNTFVGTDSTGNPVTILGYDTHPGWDAVTGWGSPNIGNLIFGPDFKNAVKTNAAPAQ